MNVALEATVGKLWGQTSSVGQINVSSSPRAFYRIACCVGVSPEQLRWSGQIRGERQEKGTELFCRRERKKFCFPWKRTQGVSWRNGVLGNAVSSNLEHFIDAWWKLVYQQLIF